MYICLYVIQSQSLHAHQQKLNEQRQMQFKILHH